MNANSLSGLRQSVSAADEHHAVRDEKMDQVRDLLIGDYVRRTENRMAAIEARLRDMETDFSRRLDALHSRLEAMAGEMTGERRSDFDELSKIIGELGERVRGISRR